MAPIPAWRVASTVYNVMFVIFAIATVVQFLRKQNEFYLRGRFPRIALVQLAVLTVTCIDMELVAPFVSDFETRCYSEAVLAQSFGAAVLILQVFRAAGLSWRIYVSKRVADSRTGLRTKISGTALRRHPPPLLTRIHAMPCLRIAFIAYFTTVFAVTLISANVEFFGIGGCYGLTKSYILAITYGNILSAFVTLLWFVNILGRFRDRFRFHVELKRVAIIYGVYLPFVAIVVMLGQFQIVYRTMAYFCQVSFIVSGVLPLLEQRRFDRKVKHGNFGDLDTFEDVLNDGAALAALEAFMRREFCDEMLAFYQIVEEFKASYEVVTPLQQYMGAYSIFNQFISIGAPSQINISKSCIDKIRIALFGTSDPNQVKLYRSERTPSKLRPISKDLYNRAQTVMVRLIHEGPFLRFQVSRSMQTAPITAL